MHRPLRHMSPRRKRLGQVFLRDPAVIDNILASAHIQPNDTVLEIGPGQGALTGALARQAGRLYALEIDARYAETLRQRFAPAAHVSILHADARVYDYGQLPSPLLVVANLPYSVGMVILRRLFTFRRMLSRLCIMLQREVAARLLAPPNTSAYGAVSVFFQYYATLQHCLDVPRQAFTPVPAVDSTVLTLQPLQSLPWPSQNEPFLFHVVQCAFAHRRKTLRANLLAASSPRLTRPQLLELFTALQLPDHVRAQELHVAQFVQLATALQVFLTDGHGTPGDQLQELSEPLPTHVL